MPTPQRAGGGREFFTTVTVGAALQLLADLEATPGEQVPLADALGRTPVATVTAPAALPGFARSTVDGFAVRAADTFGASDGLPTYLDLVGEVAMGRPATVAVRAGTAVAVPDRRGAARRCRRRRDGRAHPGDHARHRRGRPAGSAGRRDRCRRRGRRRRCGPGAGRSSAARRGPRPARGRRRGGARRAPPAPGGRRVHRRRGGAARHGHPRPRARSATRPPRPSAGWSPTPAGSRCRSASWPTTVPLWRRCCARPSPPATSSWSRPGRRWAPATSPPTSSPASGSRASSATGSRSGRASRRSWPTATAYRWSGCRATRSRRWSSSGCSAYLWYAGSRARPARRPSR